MKRAILFLDIDSFFASVEVALNPDLRGKPLIIGGLRDERGVVCTASYEARRYGVHSGMALRIAARKCPQAIFLRGRYALYQRYSERFFQCLQRFSPQVIQASIDEAYLDLSGLQYLWPSPVDLARHIKLTVENELGIKLTAALSTDVVSAKIAAELAKPAGFFWVIDRDHFLSTLPLEMLPGFGPQNVAIFRTLGIKRVVELEKHFPALYYSTTNCGNKIFQVAEVKSCSRETTFPYDLNDDDRLLAHLAYLLQRIAATLASRKLYARRLEVKVRYSDFSNFSMRQEIPFATNSYLLLWRYAREIFFRLRPRRNLPLRLVGVKVDDLITCRSRLLPFVSAKEEKLQQALLKIEEKFGLAAVCPASTLFLNELYPRERNGFVLKTASLTR